MIVNYVYIYKFTTYMIVIVNYGYKFNIELQLLIINLLYTNDYKFTTHVIVNWIDNFPVMEGQHQNSYL